MKAHVHMQRRRFFEFGLYWEVFLSVVVPRAQAMMRALILARLLSSATMATMFTQIR